MKRIWTHSILLVLVIGAIVLGIARAQSFDAEAILKKTDEVEGFHSNFSKVQQIITTSSEQKRTLIVRGGAVNNGKK